MGRNSYILCKHGAAATLERIITLLLRKTICKCIQIVDLFISRNNVIYIYIVCIVFLLCILVQCSMILQQTSLFGGEKPLFLGVPWLSSHCPGKNPWFFCNCPQLSPIFLAPLEVDSKASTRCRKCWVSLGKKWSLGSGGHFLTTAFL